MAEQEKEEAAGTEAGGGGKKKLIIIILIVVIVLAGGGVGAFFALSGDKKAEGAEGEDAEHEENLEELEEGTDAPLSGAVMPLDTFIVNLRVKGSFLKATVQLEFEQPEIPPTMQKEIPKIRDAIIRLLSSKSASDILTPEGKEVLAGDIIEVVNEALGSEDVTNVFFTEFIIQ